jgi:ATPase subunit of ABC transporter with duplicated ATPase domains
MVRATFSAIFRNSIAVTHDRYFLDNVAGWILELDRGEGIPWKETIFLVGPSQSRMAREEKWLQRKT